MRAELIERLEPRRSGVDPGSETRAEAHTVELVTLSVVLLAGLVVCYVFAIRYRLGPELHDDGAFFLRYAENVAHGQFWVWNPGHSPVWGASAPLWPLVVGVPIAAGIGPLTAMVATSVVLSAVSLSALTVLLWKRFGFGTGLAFATFSMLDSGLMYYSGSGLETPLTLALLTAGIWVVLYPVRPWVTAAVAGLIMIDKIDLIPAGVLLLLAVWLRDRKLPRTAGITAACVAAGWYVFAWAYFGKPFPNSFVTKAFDQNSFNRIITWTWFGKTTLVQGVHKWFTLLAVLAIFAAVVRRSALGVFLAGIVIVDVIAYTVKYPFEPYTWYTMPATLCLIVGAACGVGVVGDLTARLWRHATKAPRKRKAVATVAALPLIAAAVLPWLAPAATAAQADRSWSSNQEYDRAQAGRWVSAHTPHSFVVFTDWGNPAVYSQREVIDGSFLNRPYESGDLIARYRPEVLILQNNPGSSPSKPVFAFNTKGYRIAHLFAKSFGIGLDYFFAVLIRDDVAAQLH